MRKLIWLAAAAVAIAGAGLAQAQETPRKGGTIRMTAPYAASFGSLDPHTTPRAQDEIVGKALNRTLYNWDSANSKLVLELAKSVTASADGLAYTYKLRDDAYFHNGRKMTADDIIWSFTRIMDGSKGYPGARYVRLIKGAVEVEKGQAKEISGLKKIDDFTLEMTLTDNVDPGFYFFDGTTAILPKEEVEKGNFAANPVGLGPVQVQGAHSRARASSLERWEKVLQARQALRRPHRSCRSWPRPRRATSRSATRRSTPRSWARRPVRRLSRRSRALQGHPRGRRDVHARDAHEPRLQAVRRQARAPGDQPRHRHRPDHQAAGQGQGLSRRELAAADLAGLRQDA